MIKMKKSLPVLILVYFLVQGICFPKQGYAIDENNAISAIRTGLEKWVETKQLISREKHRWQSQKQILTGRTLLLHGQVQDLERKIEEARASIEKSKEKQETLATEHRELEAALSLLREAIAKNESRLLTLLSRLPAPVQEQVEPLSQEIPLEPAQTGLPLSTRYQNIIGVLNFINKFTNAITMTTELRTLEADKAVEVQVMYVGLGQAYFANDSGTIGGTGRPSSEGWLWERQDDIAPAVTSAIAMYNNEIPAEYVVLPVEIAN